MNLETTRNICLGLTMVDLSATIIHEMYFANLKPNYLGYAFLGSLAALSTATLVTTRLVQLQN